MLYVEHYEYKNKYYKAQKDFDAILSEKEHLFAKTQPKATSYDKEITSGGTIKENPFDQYVAKLLEDNIDARLKEAREILKDRELLLKLKESELKQSKDWYDIAYTYRYIEGYPVRKIGNKMPYCRSSIYNMLEKIEKNISLDKNGQKL